MKTSAFFILLTLSSVISWAQSSCVQHWSHNKSQIVELDSILASINLQRVDTIYCDSVAKNTRLNPKWYIDFYTKHFGNYFSNPRCVCFAMLRFGESNDPATNEIHITQFVLNDNQTKAFRRKYGSISKKQLSYNIEAFTSCKYIVKGNTVYFISTETYSLAQRKDSFFEDLVVQIQRR